jgi:hypothetical protein
MGSQNDPWLAFFLLLVVTGILFLRVRFPEASRRSETAVLIVATVLFFGICRFLVRR